MIRGTTPTHTFTIPFAADDIKEVRIIYAQSGQEVFTKTTEDCALDGRTVSVRLVQEDTFALESTSSVQIQLRILTQDGEVHACDPLTVMVGTCLDDEVLT